MFCKKCGKRIEDKVSFCGNCGDKNLIESNKGGDYSSSTNVNLTPVDADNDIIKCGNCNYLGHGEKARSGMAVVLVWLCVFIAWPITVIYFLTTSKYRCPKCQSTFLGIKNKDSVFIGQKNNAKNPILIIIYVLVGIAFLGIISSVILASLNTARTKASNAAKISDSINPVNQLVLVDFKLLKKEFNDLNGSQTVTNNSFESTGLSSTQLKQATLEFDSDTGEPLVSLQFNNIGSELFAKITRENIGRRLAIYFNGEIIAMPVIREEVTGGKATVSGSFSGPDGLKEARDLVNKINLSIK